MQSGGLIARVLESNGIATTLTSWLSRVKLVGVPRLTVSKLARGATLGHPHDEAQQQRVLDATLALLAEDAPLAPVMLDEE